MAYNEIAGCNFEELLNPFFQLLQTALLSVDYDRGQFVSDNSFEVCFSTLIDCILSSIHSIPSGMRRLFQEMSNHISKKTDNSYVELITSLSNLMFLRFIGPKIQTYENIDMRGRSSLSLIGTMLMKTVGGKEIKPETYYDLNPQQLLKVNRLIKENQPQIEAYLLHLCKEPKKEIHSRSRPHTTPQQNFKEMALIILFIQKHNSDITKSLESPLSDRKVPFSDQNISMVKESYYQLISSIEEQLRLSQK